MGKKEDDIGIIPFNQPWIPCETLDLVSDVFKSRKLSGNGKFTQECHEIIRNMTGCRSSFLAQSCTAALEMSALVADVSPGDEIILPSYTFVSTASAFILRGAIPVFVDVRADTLNIDESQVARALSKKTKAIVPVHYAGVSAEMDSIIDIAKSQANVLVISDAAQAFGSRYKGGDVCSVGDMSTLSFHETKNLSSGEGGCLNINRDELLENAHVSWEKGTNRKAFFEGTVDKYTWVGLGSSYLPSEVTAAVLVAQLRNFDFVQQQRMKIWNFYHEFFKEFEFLGAVKRPTIPDTCEHNAHMYFLILNQRIDRNPFLDKLRERGVHAVFHYVPLHSSPMGRRYGRVVGSMVNTDRAGSSLIRLPLWVGMTLEQLEYVCKSTAAVLEDFMND
jgi:dTDP-4-amino-4,6-dideoxygalactose transaminase